MKAKTEAAAAQAKAEARAAEMERLAEEAKCDRHNISLYTECLNRYINSMRRSIGEVTTFHNQAELQRIHSGAKSASLSEVCRFS